MNVSYGNEEFIKKQFCVREGGTLLLRCKSSYTRFEGAEKYNTLYEMMSQNCERWAQNVLGERIRQEFVASDDEQKKFRFGSYEYSFSSYIGGEDSEKLCVISDASLTRRGQREPIEFRRSSQLWRKSDLALMPDAALLPKKKSRELKNTLKRKPTGFFMRGGDVFAFGGSSPYYWEEKVSLRKD